MKSEANPRYEVEVRDGKGSILILMNVTTYNLVDSHLFFRDMRGRAHNIRLTPDTLVHVTDIVSDTRNVVDI